MITQHLPPAFRVAAFRISAAFLAGLLTCLLAGCMGKSGPPAKKNLSALWVETLEAKQLDVSRLSRLTESNIQEIYMPLAELKAFSGESFSGEGSGEEGPLSRAAWPDLDPSVRLTVVISGKLQLKDQDPKAAAEAIGPRVQQMLLSVESRGVVPIGVHFDLQALDSIELGADFFKYLRGQLDPSFFLSLSLRRSWMEREDLGSLVKAVDFVVPFLYGQRASEKDSPDAWDFKVISQRLDRLEEFKVPYMVGIIGIGNVTHTNSQGKVKNFTAKQALHPFMWNRGLELKRGFSLQAAKRRTYTLVAKQKTRVGDWEIGVKDEIHLIRPMTTDLDKLLDVLAEKERPHLIGQLYYRLTSSEERLSIGLENILNALDSKPIVPDLKFDVRISRRTSRGARYRFFITNHNQEPTEYSLLDNNYVQIKATPNAFGDVALGDFYRYDLLQMKPNGESKRMFRDANAIRLHLPILDGQQEVSTGNVEIKGRNPTFEVRAKFLMPDGRTVEFGPFTWKDGVLKDVEGAADGERDDGA